MVRPIGAIAAVVAAGTAVFLFTKPFPAAEATSAPALHVLYPKQASIVGRRVNLVFDPATDWAAVPAVQVVVGKTEHPVVDTSGGRHAIQGIPLEPGENAITVRVLRPQPRADTGQGKGRGSDNEAPAFTVVLSQTVTVYNREESFAAAPQQYTTQYFHARDQEADCSGCHRLEAEQADRAPAKPEDLLCFSCHREITNTPNVHGPAAVWNCLACHDPELYPVKYQFTAENPWTVSKTLQSVEPAVFTLAADDLFKQRSAVLLSDDVPAVPKKKPRALGAQEWKDLVKKRDDEVRKRKERERGLLQPLLDHLQHHPTDKVRIEAHVDDTPLPPRTGAQAKGFKSLKDLTDARARALDKLLRSYGVAGKGRIRAVGMGSSLPKVPNVTKENRLINNRIECVAHPPDVQVKNSMKLPLLQDRERVVVSLAYAPSASGVKKLKLRERLPRGLQYLKGSGVFRASVKDPQVKGDDLVWELGDAAPGFREILSFVVKKDTGTVATADPVIRLAYTTGRNEQTREFDPRKPFTGGLTVREVCDKCHGPMTGGTFNHGPAEAGYCNLCHDPHGSEHPSWTRLQSWRLCTTCHREKETEVHVIAGFARSVSHPTRKHSDPSRPGRRLSCVSCHTPHSSESPDLLKFGVRRKEEICDYCHRNK